MSERDALLAAIPAELRTRDVCGVLDGMIESNDYAATPVLVDAVRDAGGTEDHVLSVVRSLIYGVPKADAPRLWYADWLRECGEVQQAEFIRCQVQLARLGELQCKTCNGRGWYSISDMDSDDCIYCDLGRLRRRERESLGPTVGGTNMRENEAKWLEGSPLLLGREIAGGGWMRAFEVEWHRGFISSITISWADWLRHHERLFWSPRQTIHCELCFPLPKHIREQCTRCPGTGRIPRSFVNTAQLIETVRLTAWTAEGLMAELIPGANHFMMPGTRYSFDRVKCGTCDGNGSGRSGWDERPICASCNGHPLNRWQCEAWPGVQFVMPEENGYAAMMDEAIRQVAERHGMPPHVAR